MLRPPETEKRFASGTSLSLSDLETKKGVLQKLVDSSSTRPEPDNWSQQSDLRLTKNLDLEEV